MHAVTNTDCKYRRKTGLCVLRIAKYGSLALQIVHFPFSLPLVYRPNPLHARAEVTQLCMRYTRPRKGTRSFAGLYFIVRLVIFSSNGIGGVLLASKNDPFLILKEYHLHHHCHGLQACCIVQALQKDINDSASGTINALGHKKK